MFEICKRQWIDKETLIRLYFHSTQNSRQYNPRLLSLCPLPSIRHNKQLPAVIPYNLPLWTNTQLTFSLGQYSLLLWTERQSTLSVGRYNKIARGERKIYTRSLGLEGSDDSYWRCCRMADIWESMWEPRLRHRSLSRPWLRWFDLVYRGGGFGGRMGTLERGIFIQGGTMPFIYI